MDAILNINKPPGKTSYDIVAMVKRLSGEKRVGHAGTLDPDATGVLPVCMGKSTRVIEFLVDTAKTYRAQIELGVITDTYDASGKIVQKNDPSAITREQFESAFTSFLGDIEQTPPMYSAIKYRGQPLYKLARAGIEVERKSRTIRIHCINVIDWQPPLVSIDVHCGKGTYIRSLAHDIGQSLGCGASLKNLVRLKCGPFDIVNAVSMPQLEDAFHYGYWRHYVYPMDTVLLNWNAVIVSNACEEAIKNGKQLFLDNTGAPAVTDYTGQKNQKVAPRENRCRAYNLNGDLLGVLRFDPETVLWQPQKVFI